MYEPVARHLTAASSRSGWVRACATLERRRLQGICYLYACTSTGVEQGKGSPLRRAEDCHMRAQTLGEASKDGRVSRACSEKGGVVGCLARCSCELAGGAQELAHLRSALFLFCHLAQSYAHGQCPNARSVISCAPLSRWTGARALTARRNLPLPLAALSHSNNTAQLGHCPKIKSRPRHNLDAPFHCPNSVSKVIPVKHLAPELHRRKTPPAFRSSALPPTEVVPAVLAVPGF